MQKVKSKRLLFVSITITLIIAFNVAISYINSGYSTNVGTVDIEDGEKLFYIAHIPKANGPKPLAILMHGFGGSSEMMDMIAGELANNGILTIAYDNRGHGKSGSYLSFNQTLIYSDFSKILEVGLKYGANLNSIAIIGHSIGAYYAQSLAKNDSRIKCLVIIGATPTTDFLDKDSKINVLVLNGANDEITSIETALSAFKNITEVEHPEVGVTYGDFEQNNARELYISGLNDHLTILYSSNGVKKTVEWVSQFYKIGKLVFSNDIKLALFLLISVLAFLLVFPLLRDIRENLAIPPEKVDKVSSVSKLAPTYLAGTFFAGPFTLLLQVVFMLFSPGFVSTFVLGFFYSQIVAFYIVFYVHKKDTDNGFRELLNTYLVKDKLPLRILYSAIIAIVVYVLYYLMFQHFFNIEISSYRIGMVIVLAVLLIPYVTFNEIFYRAVLSTLGKGLRYKVALSMLMRVSSLVIFYIVIMMLFGTSGGTLGFLTIILYMVAILQLSFDLISLYLFQKSRSITEQVIWNSIIYAILLTAVSPIYY
ncbi:MAG: alpha/beta fold hydrolase [Nitrososphaeria archaeon]